MEWVQHGEDLVNPVALAKLGGRRAVHRLQGVARAILAVDLRASFGLLPSFHPCRLAYIDLHASLHRGDHRTVFAIVQLEPIVAFCGHHGGWRWQGNPGPEAAALLDGSIPARTMSLSSWRLLAEPKGFSKVTAVQPTVGPTRRQHSEMQS